MENTAEVLLGGGLLVGVDILEKRAADEELCLGPEMVGQDGVEIYEAELSREHCPI